MMGKKHKKKKKRQARRRSQVAKANDLLDILAPGAIVPINATQAAKANDLLRILAPGAIVPINATQAAKANDLLRILAPGAIVPINATQDDIVTASLRFWEGLAKSQFGAPKMVVGEIVAWRAWWWRDDGLRSVFYERRWTPGKPMTGLPQVPWAGVHAFKTEAMARNYARGGLPAWLVVPFGTPIIIGRVELWGNVYEHEDGYRAEYAAVKSLDYIITGKRWWSPLQRRRFMALKGKYECK